MKKYLSLLFFYCLFSADVGAQVNLVLNASFEDTVKVTSNYPTPLTPNIGNNDYKCKYWYDPNGTSSDYDNPTTGGIYNSVPTNLNGYQPARTGKAYAGFVAYYKSGAYDVREYIAGYLSQPLIKNKTYCVEFHLNLSNYNNLSIDKIGIYFSQYAPVPSPLGLVWNLIPQVKANSVITDTVNWTMVSGQFVAQGGEQNIAIGNFFSNILTDTIHLADSSAFQSYYYIDDVSVICCDCEDTAKSSVIIPNVFTPNNDGINDVWQVKNLPQGTTIEIFNRWGIKVVRAENVEDNFLWDGWDSADVKCTDGVYYYVITTAKETYKGFLELVR